MVLLLVHDSFLQDRRSVRVMARARGRPGHFTDLNVEATGLLLDNVVRVFDHLSAFGF